MFKRLAGRLAGLPKNGFILLAIFLAIAYIIFFWRLGSLTHGLSPAEVAARASSRSLNAIYNNPVNAPHKLLQYGFQKINSSSITLLRLPSVIFGIIFAFGFYRLCVGLFGRSIGTFGALMFVSLPLFVVASRQASAEIMFFAPAILMYLYSRLVKGQKNQTLIWFVSLIVSAILVFTPGMLIWMLAGFWLCRKKIVLAIEQVPTWASAVGIGAIVAALVPVVLASIKHPSVAKALFLVPLHPAGVLRMLENTGWMAASLFVKTGHYDPLIVSRLPLLDILLTALLVFGVYAMYGAAKAKAAMLGLSVLFAIIAAGVNNDIAMLAFGLPPAAVFAAAGLRYLYIEWRTIFPRNPVPKTFALVLIALVAAVQVYFGLRYSVDAWPNTQSSKVVYVLK